MPLRLFNIRQGEERRCVLMFAYIFLVIGALMIVKPVAQAEFLAAFGPRQLPFVFILVALFAAGISAIYGRLLGTIDLLVLIRRTLHGFIALLAVVFLSLSLHFAEPFMLYSFFVAVSIFGVLAASQFWILANIVFNPREAKRLFGFIGSGAIAGGILGGYATKLLAPALGSENLVLVGGALLLSCGPIVRRIWELGPTKGPAAPAQGLRVGFGRGGLTLSAIRSSRHLASLAAVVVLGVAAGKFIEYQFVAIAADRIQDEERLAAFLGFWYSNLNVFSLVIQLFITRQVVGVFGVGTSLLVHPVAVLVGALGVLVHPALSTAIVLKVGDGGLKNSIQKSALELFSLPIPPEIRNPAKSFIDVFGDAFATGVSGLLLLVLTTILDVPVRYVSLMVLVLVAAWLLFVRRLRAEYLDAVWRRVIADQAPETAAADLHSESVLGGLIVALGGHDEEKLIETLTMVRDIRSDRLAPSFLRLLAHPSARVRLGALANLSGHAEDHTPAVEPMVRDPDLEIRAEAIQYLFGHDRGDPVANLLARLDDPDEEVRRAALLCAARESRSNGVLQARLDIRARIEANFRALRGDRTAEGTRRRAFCARAIGTARIPALNHLLHILLRDPAPEVVDQALIAAGQTREHVYLGLLLQHLAVPRHRDAALHALAHHDPDIIGLLADLMRDPAADPALRLLLPGIIGRIGTQRAVDVLVDQLETVPGEVRHRIVEALHGLRSGPAQLRFNDKRIVHRILEEARLYSETLGVFGAQVRSRDEAASPAGSASRQAAARARLMEALEVRLDQALATIFKLLGLRYPPRDIETVYNGVRSGREEARMNSVEYLDNLLDGPLKRTIIPIVESALVEDLERRTRTQPDLTIPDQRECLENLLQDDDPLLVSAVLELIAAIGERGFAPHVCALLGSRLEGIPELAEVTLKELDVL